MKKLVFGFVLGVLLSTSINVIGNELIDKAEFNSVKVSYNGNTLDLNQGLLSVQTQGNNNAVNYMPVRAVLESLGFTVNWNEVDNLIEVSDRTVNARSSNISLDNVNDDEWISVNDMIIIYDYKVADGQSGAGVFLNTDTESLFYSEVGSEDNIVRIVKDGNDFKLNKADLLAIGIDLDPIN